VIVGLLRWGSSYGTVSQGSGSSKNSSGSGFSSGAASLVELEPFCKIFSKTVSLVGVRL